MSFWSRFISVALLIVLVSGSLGCATDERRAHPVQEPLVLDSLPLEHVEGELAGRVWLKDGLLISVKEADGVTSEYLLRNRYDVVSLEEAPLGAQLELSYYPDDENSIPVVSTIIICDD